MLAAMSATSELARSDRGYGPELFQIEILSDDGWPVKALAAFTDEALARAVFAHAAKMGPIRKIRLRIGARVLVDANTR